MNPENISPGKTINFKYKFTSVNGGEKIINTNLDRKTMSLMLPQRETYPEWTELKYFKCLNCSLDGNLQKYCPIALSIIDLVDIFKNAVSYEEVEVQIETEARNYTRRTSLQSGLSSLMGIYMVTSGCPVMEKLKPMVCHHLPFATPEETLYRVTSMYLLAQFFLYKKGQTAGLGLKGVG